MGEVARVHAAQEQIRLLAQRRVNLLGGQLDATEFNRAVRELDFGRRLQPLEKGGAFLGFAEADNDVIGGGLHELDVGQLEVTESGKGKVKEDTHLGRAGNQLAATQEKVGHPFLGQAQAHVPIFHDPLRPVSDQVTNDREETQDA